MHGIREKHLTNRRGEESPLFFDPLLPKIDSPLA
nr:MAG TPA: hypothetical protein [Caudoviricetes sp.]